LALFIGNFDENELDWNSGSLSYLQARKQESNLYITDFKSNLSL